MAIKYPGEQKIGYGKAQVFDTSKLAEGARYAAQVLDKKKKEKKKAKDDFLKGLKDIDVSKIRQVDTDYITKQVNAVSEYFYNNSAAILNPKLDGGKAAMEVQRLKQHAIGEVQKSIGIKEEDKAMEDRIASDTEHFGTTENYTLHRTRTRTPMNHNMWNDHETPTTYTETDLSMTEEEKADFYSKSVSEQQNILKERLPSQQLLNKYNSLKTDKEKQQFLLEQNLETDLGDTGPNDDGVDGKFGKKSRDAEKEFLDRETVNVEIQSNELGKASDVSQYDSYEEYKRVISTDIDGNEIGMPASVLSEEEFNSLKDSYNQYETKWNESQGTFDVTTSGGELIVGLHNRQLNANPMLGDHIQEVAANIQFNELEIEKIATERVGEGNVNIFETKKEIAKEQIINGIKMSIENHRFNPEMIKELNEELSVRQQTDKNLTLEDLILEKAQPFIKNDSKIDFVRDIVKPKTNIRVSGGYKPPAYDYVAPIDKLDHSYENVFPSGPRTADGGKLMNYDLIAGEINGRNVQGVDVGSIVGTEGSQHDILNLTTTRHGIKLLEETKGGFTNYTDWIKKSGTYRFNPQFIFPAVTAKSKITISGRTFMPGERIPISGEGLPNMDAYHEIVDGKLTHPKVEMVYFLQGTVVQKGQDDAPAITRFEGTVRSQMNHWIKKQTKDNRTVSHMNSILGIGTSKLPE